MERPRPDLTPEAVYAEIAQVPGGQVFVGAFKTIVKTNQVDIVHITDAPKISESDTEAGVDALRLTALSDPESIEISLELTRQAADRAITLSTPLGSFWSDRCWDEFDGVFIESGPFFLLDTPMDDQFSPDEVFEDSSLLARVSKAFVDASSD